MQGVLNSFKGAKITDYSAAVKGLSLNQAQLLLTTQGLNAEKSKEVLQNAGLIASENAIQAELLESTLIKAGLNKEERETILNKLGLIQGEGAEAIVQGTCTKKKLEAVLAQKLKNAEDAEGIIKALGLAGANTTTTASFGLLTKSILANIKAMAAWMVSNPLGWLMLAGVAIAGVVGIVDSFTTSVKEHEENLQNLKSEYSEIKSELEGLNNELKTTQDRIAELESKDKLTFTEGEELENLRKQNNELQRSIDLARLKEKEANKKKNAEFIATMSADVDKRDVGVQSGYNVDGSIKEEIINETEYIERQYKALEEYRNKLNQKGLDKVEKRTYQSYIDDIEEYIRKKNNEFAQRAEGIDYIQSPTSEDDKKVNKWLDYINDFQDKMAIAMGGDNAKENAFNRLVDNWKFDEVVQGLQDLGKEGKVTAEMLKNPAYDAFLQKLIDIGFISGDTEGSLRFVANAFNGVGGSASLSAAKTGEAINAIISDLDNEAKACGTTNEEFGKLIGQHVLFGNTSLKTQDKIIAIKALESALGDCSDEMKYLLSLFNAAAGAYSTKNPHVLTDGDRTGSAELELARIFGTFNKVDIPEEKDIYTGTKKDKDSSKDNTPDYEDPTDAIINRINLRADELAQQEEEIQNLIEIAELEKDYKKQISLTNDKLDVQRQKVDALKTANSELHQMAEDLRNNTPDWDEESWFNSQGEETQAYIDFINKRIKDGADKEEIESIKDQFEKISKIKKAWVENDEERLSLIKEILQTEEDIVNLDFEHSQDWIDERNTYNDWSLFNDSEIDAWERVIKRLKEDYKDCAGAAEKLKEAEENLFEARKEQFDKSTDLGSSYYDSKKTLLQSYFDVTNSIAEAQHEINKELEASKTMYEYLDEDTRKLLFNQEDWNILSEELYDIQYKAEKLQRQYTYDLDNATLDTVEKITSNYEMQYEMLMKSYEIAKADLEIAKKKQKLDNVLNERNVRMRINGEWQYVAKTQDVIDAQSELADAEYAKRVEESGLTQQKSINDVTKKQNQLGTIISQFSNGVISLDGAIDNIVSRFRDLPDNILNSLRGISSSSSSSSRTYDYSGRTLQAHPDGTAPSYAKKGDIIKTAGGDYLITGGTAGNFSSIKIKERHADGTRYTPGGMTALGEEDFEAFIDNNGHLIPINQPTIGNISSGGIVFNQDQMTNLRSLWDLSSIGTMPNTNISNITNRQTSEIINYQLFGDMIFDGNNPEEIFRKMADFFKNTRYKSN